jgi:predicted house-cleaning noncanonical NTP pyrophosphatase (MazG superfamily)
LVRDKIPEIIESAGKKCNSKTISDKEAILFLVDKIKEEADEFIENSCKEEVADVLEVVYSIIKKSGWTLEEVEKLRLDKNQKRGGFEKNIFLINTDKL